MNLTLLICLSATTQAPDFTIPLLSADSDYTNDVTRNQPGKSTDLDFRSIDGSSRLFFWFVSQNEHPGTNFTEAAGGEVGKEPPEISEKLVDGYSLGLRAQTFSVERLHRIETFLPDGFASFSFYGTKGHQGVASSKPNSVAARSKWLIAFRQFCARLAAYRAGNGDSFQAKVTKVEFQKVTKFESLDGVWPNASQVRIRAKDGERIYVLGANGYKKNGIWQELNDAPIVKNDELFVPSDSLRN